jgi:hypothetical protein
MAACTLLDQFRDRGMPDTIQRKILEKTFDAEKLKDLVQNFKAAIQAHDAKVAAAQVAVSAHESLAMQPVDGMHASFSAFPSFSTEIPSSVATEGNTNGTERNTKANSQLGAVDLTSRCTIKLSRSHNKDQRRYQEAQNVTLVAAARAVIASQWASGGDRADHLRRLVAAIRRCFKNLPFKPGGSTCSVGHQRIPRCTRVHSVHRVCS